MKKQDLALLFVGFGSLVIGNVLTNYSWRKKCNALIQERNRLFELWKKCRNTLIANQLTWEIMSFEKADLPELGGNA